MEKTKEGGRRMVGNTELSWCRAVPGGTGIAVLAILLSKNPGITLLQSALKKLQDLHPVLRSKLRYEKSKETYYFVVNKVPSSPTVQINKVPSSPAVQINKERSADLHLILEKELNHNQWNNHDVAVIEEEQYVMHASMYELPKGRAAVALRLHMAACDRTTTVSVLEKLLELLAQEKEHKVADKVTQCTIGPCIEDVVPSEKMGRKNLLERFGDLCRYSWGYLWLSNLKFDNASCPKKSLVVRLQLSTEHTKKIQSECKMRNIKLCGALVASVLLAAHEGEIGETKKQKAKTYGVITLVDCRSLLKPLISQQSQSLGFYHSAILNKHLVKGGETFWDTAKNAYKAFQNSKKEDKHFADMADLNNLMFKAIDNPDLTKRFFPRTSLVSVFEDTVINDSQSLLGMEDYMGCASVHGIGPSLAIYDTIRDGSLDCVCVFPAPLHSTEQMEKFVGRMKKALINGTSEVNDIGTSSKKK